MTALVVVAPDAEPDPVLDCPVLAVEDDVLEPLLDEVVPEVEAGVDCVAAVVVALVRASAGS